MTSVRWPISGVSCLRERARAPGDTRNLGAYRGSTQPDFVKVEAGCRIRHGTAQTTTPATIDLARPPKRNGATPAANASAGPSDHASRSKPQQAAASRSKPHPLGPRFAGPRQGPGGGCAPSTPRRSALRRRSRAAGSPVLVSWRRAKAAAAEVEHERTRQVAHIGNNLNQIARWANTYASAAEAVEVAAQLVAIERAIAALASWRGAT